jgi:hypothetical protein
VGLDGSSGEEACGDVFLGGGGLGLHGVEDISDLIGVADLLLRCPGVGVGDGENMESSALTVENIV